MTILNIGLETIVEYLKKKPGLEPTKELNPNTKLTDQQFEALLREFASDKLVKEKAELVFKKKSKKEKATGNQKSKEIVNPSPLKRDPINDYNEIVPVTKPTSEENIEEEILVPVSKFHFGTNHISYKKGTSEFVFWVNGISQSLNSAKNNSFNNVSTKILLNYPNQSFKFLDLSLLARLKDQSSRLDNEMFEKHLRNVEKKKEQQQKANTKKEKQDKAEKKTKQKIEHRIQFNAIKFSRSLASIIYKKQRYIYRDYNIKEYDRILGQVYSRVSKARMNAIKTSLVWVIIDTETETFTFKDIDINKYVNNLKDNFLPESKKVENRLEKKIVPQKPSSATKTMTLGAGNIRFYNDYFLIFQPTNEQIDNSVAPYRVNDPDSHEILNLVHNYFEQRFEQMRIVVKHDGTKILEPSRLDIFQLKNYVRALRRNLEVKGEWWEEVQNARKRSFAQCFGESRDSVKSKYVKSKNEYLYNLSSLQNDKKLIRVYEINHGKEEDAFIFTIDMSGNRNAIIFENASNDASTTTWVFVAKNENYEACVNLIFDYFTDYTISSKRSSLRAKNVNPPEKFKADSYAFIDHDDLEQWLKKLNRILENKPQPSEIRFVPGLNIPQSSETRMPSGNAITTSNLHNQLMLKLYDKLCSESGKENVGTEIRVGTKRIDAVVKGKGFYDIYEVKTASNSFDCVTEALGQICQYAYLYCRDNIGKMVIVGAPAASSEVEQYLSWFRKKHSMEVYYMQVPLI